MLNLIIVKMGALFSVLRAMLPILAGVGVGKLSDKFLADKLPNYPADGVSGGGTNKIIWTAIIFAVGAVVWSMLSRRLKLKF